MAGKLYSKQTVDLGKKGSFTEKKGAYHAMKGIPEGETIPKSVEEADAKKGGLLARRAKSALGFRAMHHG
jgi:hypothetical protein